MDSSSSSFFDKQPILILDHETHDIIDANDVALDLYGYSRDELLSMNVRDLGIKKKRVELIDELNNDDGSVDKIWVMRTRDGRKIYTQFTYHVFYHKNRPAKMAIAHDVSELVAAQESKRRKFPRFVTHESNFPLAEIEWNSDMVVRNWSEKAQELFGWTEEEVIGKDDFFEMMVPEDELEAARQNIHDAVKNGNINYSAVGKINTKRGETLICEWHNSLIYDKNEELHSMHSLVSDISKRKESQHLFRTLSEKSLVGVFLIQDGEFKYVNPRLAEIFDYDQQELIEHFSPQELIHPSDQKLIKENMEERLNGTSVSEEYEVQGVTKNGRIIDISLYGAKTQYKGKPAIVGTVVDVTDDKEIIRRYQASVETFRDLFDTISDAIYIQDREGRFLEVNQGAMDMFGYDHSYFIGETPEVLAAPGKVDLDNATNYVKRALEGEQQNFTWWGKRKNGEVFPIEIVANPGTYFGEKAVITIARDISDRYKAEEELRKNEELFRQLFQNAPIPITLLDKRQEIRQVNDAFSDVFGYKTDEVQGLNIDKLIVPDSEQDSAHDISEKIFNGKPVHGSGPRLTKEGELRDVLIYGVPVTVNDKTVAIFGIYVDISERKQAEEHIKKSLKEKEVLLAEIHHRVKNNLAVITGLLELQSYNTSSEKATNVLRTSQMRVNSIALIHEKLYQNEDLSEISFDVYLKELIDVIVSTLKSAETDVSLNINAEAIKLTINQAIPCGLILNELITNTYKHAFPDREEGSITIELDEENGQVTMCVKDDGVGISNEECLENPTSLGFKLIKTLTKQLEGKSQFENRNTGTEFTLTFELAD